MKLSFNFIFFICYISLNCIDGFGVNLFFSYVPFLTTLEELNFAKEVRNYLCSSNILNCCEYQPNDEEIFELNSYLLKKQFGRSCEIFEEILSMGNDTSSCVYLFFDSLFIETNVYWKEMLGEKNMEDIILFSHPLKDAISYYGRRKANYFYLLGKPWKKREKGKCDYGKEKNNNNNNNIGKIFEDWHGKTTEHKNLNQWKSSLNQRLMEWEKYYINWKSENVDHRAPIYLPLMSGERKQPIILMEEENEEEDESESDKMGVMNDCYNKLMNNKETNENNHEKKIFIHFPTYDLEKKFKSTTNNNNGNSEYNNGNSETDSIIKQIEHYEEFLKSSLMEMKYPLISKNQQDLFNEMMSN